MTETASRDHGFADCGLRASSPLRALFGKPYWRFAGAVLGIETVAAVCCALSPVVQRSLIDGVNAADRARTFYSAAVLGGLLLVIMLGRTGSYLLRYRLGVEARCRIKSAVFHQLAGMPEDLLRDRGSGYFFNRMQSDSMAVVQFYSGNGMLQFADLLRFGFAYAVIFWMNGMWACLLLPFLLLQYGIFCQYRKKQYRLGCRIQECTAAERFRMQEYLSGHTTLKTHSALTEAGRKLDQGFSRWRALAFQRLFHENRFRIFLEMPLYFCCGVVGICGLQLILQQQWTLGGLWAMLLLIRQVFAPSQRLAMARFQMQGVQASWDRLRQLENRSGAEAGGECTGLHGDIVFSKIDFGYTPDQPLFQDFDLTIREKSLFLLTGGNGSGKSTLLLLLLRLFESQKGEISIGGVPIGRWAAGPYRSRIGYLGQTPEFFPGTIRENLLLGSAAADDAGIMAVLKMLQSDGIVTQRPQGLDAMVRERGGNLSGGEKVRLALARELLRDTDILLLDEPAANLDYDARQQFYSLLPQLQGKRTVIAVIHDRPEVLAGCPGLTLPARENHGDH